MFSLLLFLHGLSFPFPFSFDPNCLELCFSFWEIVFAFHFSGWFHER